MDIDPKRAFTRKQFCYAERFSLTKYFKLRQRGLAPDETNIDGLIRITPEAREAWHVRMAEHAKGEAARLEAERRRELAVNAGRTAAASPLHISKRQKPPRRRRRWKAP